MSWSFSVMAKSDKRHTLSSTPPCLIVDIPVHSALCKLVFFSKASRLPLFSDHIASINSQYPPFIYCYYAVIMLLFSEVRSVYDLPFYTLTRTQWAINYVCAHCTWKHTSPKWTQQELQSNFAEEFVYSRLFDAQIIGKPRRIGSWEPQTMSESIPTTERNLHIYTDIQTHTHDNRGVQYRGPSLVVCKKTYLTVSWFSRLFASVRFFFISGSD